MKIPIGEVKYYERSVPHFSHEPAIGRSVRSLALPFIRMFCGRCAGGLRICLGLDTLTIRRSHTS